MHEEREWLEKQWNERAQKMLGGRTIRRVRYMTEEEAEEFGWDRRPLLMLLNPRKDDTRACLIYASMDNEGNNGGALFTSGDVDFPTLEGDVTSWH